jgi:hypothetical protein
MIAGETLPDELKTGFEVGNMPEWIWVAEREGKLVAMLIAAPAHIVAILLRILSTPDAELTDVRALLANAVRDMRERGFKGYVTWLNPERSNEAALLSIIQHTGGLKFSEPQVFCFGRT